MKTYKNQNIATQIAAKMTKKHGTAHEVAELNGVWAVGTAEELLAAMEAAPVPDFGAEQEAPTETPTETPANDEAPAEAPAAIIPGGALLAMSVQGAWESKGYVYTPEMKGVKRKPKTRWFAVKNLAKVVEIEGGLMLVAPAKVFTSRDIDVSTATVWAGDEPEVAEAQAETEAPATEEVA